MSDCLCEINTSDIDLTDERYKISFSNKDIGFLARSFKETGLIYPPIVRPLNNKFVIVSGFNRIRAHIYNNPVHNNGIKILVYETKSDVTEYQCLLKSIGSLAFQRQLTLAELIICTKRLDQFLDKQQIADKSPAIFNTALGPSFVGDLLTIGALPDPALELIHTGHLSFKSAKRISFFEKDTIKVFLEIFSKIHASQNKQLEIILYLMEITARDAIKPKAFYMNQEIQDILSDKKKEPGLKTKDLRAYLFEQRFPIIFKTRQRVKEKITSIKLGNKIKFLPLENLDSQTYSISFTAKNYKEFLANVQDLNAGLENKELKEIFNQ
ncbi:MAG: ParB N-terminal domain-containing protein [Deltaproteobacteria bacterium]|uniref:ParB N-terminal domain-containing protein n=1 Tax=Desulfobacula sp. TaxID=2593537 RepID=UPI001995AD11|nr:ParB N-terminal domain-containing protein [Candidatus Desulfobacula maris]MBL6993694.1 ParB N-terminal domain-containing protein [Desulfobacula sp.]